MSVATHVASRVLGVVHDEYIRSTLYFKAIDAQSPSCEYGGSRSGVYFDMLGTAQTLAEMLEARRAFLACREADTEATAYNDELGGIVRIAGYRLRYVPVIGAALEARVRADDPAMVGAAFVYPDEYIV